MKRVIQKTTGETGDLIDNKIVHKTTKNLPQSDLEMICKQEKTNRITLWWFDCNLKCKKDFLT